MEQITLDILQANINALSLSDDDIIYNIRMPLQSCEECGGYGVKDWDDQRSVLCDCIQSLDSDRTLMPYKLLHKLCTITKDEVYKAAEEAKKQFEKE